MFLLPNLACLEFVAANGRSWCQFLVNWWNVVQPDHSLQSVCNASNQESTWKGKKNIQSMQMEDEKGLVMFVIYTSDDSYLIWDGTNDGLLLWYFTNLCQEKWTSYTLKIIR